MFINNFITCTLLLSVQKCEKLTLALNFLYILYIEFCKNLFKVEDILGRVRLQDLLLEYIQRELRILPELKSIVARRTTSTIRSRAFTLKRRQNNRLIMNKRQSSYRLCIVSHNSKRIISYICYINQFVYSSPQHIVIVQSTKHPIQSYCTRLKNSTYCKKKSDIEV